MASKPCPICGGKTSHKNKHKGAICGSCMFSYKHPLGPCLYANLAPMGMARDDNVYCCRCKQKLVSKAKEDFKPLASDVELAEKLGIIQKKEVEDVG